MAADDAAKLRSAFPPEAEVQWQEYVHRATRYEATVRSQLRDVLTGEVRMTGGGTLAVSGAWALTGGSITSRNVQAGGWRVAGVNSTYTFRLSRDAEDADWRIDRLEWLAQGAAAGGLKELALAPDRPVPSGAEDQSVWHSQMRSVCQGLMLNDIWFPSMIESADFVLESLESDAEEPALIRVRFAYRPKAILPTPVRRGFVLLDRARYWLIREARTEGDWGDGATGEIIINNEFDASLDGFPLPGHHQMHWIATTGEGEPSHNVREIWFDAWKRSSVRESEYRVSAFGLPEPQPPSRWPRLWMWVVVHAAFGGYLVLWCAVRWLGKNPGA